MTENSLNIFDRSYSFKEGWSAPIRHLSDPVLQDIFREFTSILPDHAHDENTVIYLLYFRPQMPPSYELLWTCSHFEHGNNSDMKNLCKVLDRLATLSEMNSSNLELLDAFGERLIISVPEPCRTLREHVKNCGVKIITS